MSTGTFSCALSLPYCALDEAISSVLTVVNENAGAAKALTGSAGKVMAAVENIASVSEENGAAIEEASAAAEEMSAQVQKVSTFAQSLDNLAEAMKQAVDQFQVGDTLAAARHNGKTTLSG